MIMKHPPISWEHLGPAMERGTSGSPDADVTGDPCIVWDETENAFRMFYFGQRHEEGREINCIMHALSQGPAHVGPGQWRKCGAIQYENPQDLPGDAHKPYVLMDAWHINRAARVDGLFMLYFVIWEQEHKKIYRAAARKLAGPWRVQPEPVLELGVEDAFDGYHVDTVSSFYFAEQARTLLFYKGYPLVPQPDTLNSPYGSRTAAAWMKDGDTTASRAGVVLKPAGDGTWYAGWTAGMQIIPADGGGWWALCNASPTPPAPVAISPQMREPAPSLGGWAYTPDHDPTIGWQFQHEPIVSLLNLPANAVAQGECVNLWRHHLLLTDDGFAYLFYNSGAYGSERMFVRRAIIPE